MTPFELNMCALLFAEKVQGDQESDLFLSYINAYWQRIETLKSFDEMLGKEKEPKAMTEEEMLAKVMGLHSKMGGTTE